MGLNKGHVEDYINRGYHVIKDGKLLTVDIDLWEYLDGLDEEENVFVLDDLLNWRDDELSQIEIPNS